MATWVLEARSTDQRSDDVRWREYTTSKRRADDFAKIPKIQFSDSGHGVVFTAYQCRGPRKPIVREVPDWVNRWLGIIHANQQLRGAVVKIIAMSNDCGLSHAELAETEPADCSVHQDEQKAAALYGRFSEALGSAVADLKP